MGTVTPAAATSPISAAHAVAVAGAVAMEPIMHGVGRGTIDDAPDMIDRRRRRIDHALCDDDGSAAMPAMSVTFIASCGLRSRSRQRGQAKRRGATAQQARVRVRASWDNSLLPRSLGGEK